MNERPDAPVGGFNWQPGYGAFTVSASKVPEVRNYIRNQEEHHRKMTFEEELMELLRRHGVEYNPEDFEE